MRSALNFLLATAITGLLFACNNNSTKPADQAETKKQIAAMLDSFNVAAANADYERYFNFFSDGATFNGTDATENWDKPAFMAWAKPYFNKKTTWNFTAISRNIYLGMHPDIAWFDELLNTQMKLCRGSGVVIKQNGEWKVSQYVLSTTVPNNVLDTVIKIKTPIEDSLISRLSAK